MSDAGARNPGALAVEPHGQIDAAGREREREGAGPDRLDAYRLELPPRERAKRLGDGEGDGGHSSSPESSACSSCSKPPVSMAQWIPHSFGAFSSHHQRPVRAGAPGAIARVQGAQPIDVYPRSYSGWVGTSRSRTY